MKTPFKHSLLLISLLILFAGCSTTLTYKPSLLHFSTPETSGGFGEGTAELQLASGEPEYNLGTLSNNSVTSASSPISVSDAKGDVSNKLSLYIGILEKIDFYLDSNRIMGMKFQAFGSSRLSRKKGLKVSLEFRYGHKASNNTSINPFSSDTSIDMNVKDYSLNIGYRFNPEYLFYINTFRSENSVSSYQYSETLTNGVRTSFSSYTFNAPTSSQGILLGFNILQNNTTSMTLETGVSKTTWNNFEAITSFPIGINLGYIW